MVRLKIEWFAYFSFKHAWNKQIRSLTGTLQQLCFKKTELFYPFLPEGKSQRLLSVSVHQYSEKRHTRYYTYEKEEWKCSMKMNTARSVLFKEEIVVSKDGVTKLLKGLIPVFAHLFPLACHLCWSLCQLKGNKESMEMIDKVYM